MKRRKRPQGPLSLLKLGIEGLAALGHGDATGFDVGLGLHGDFLSLSCFWLSSSFTSYGAAAREKLSWLLSNNPYHLLTTFPAERG